MKVVPSSASEPAIFPVYLLPLNNFLELFACPLFPFAVFREKTDTFLAKHFFFVRNIKQGFLDGYLDSFICPRMGLLFNFDFLLGNALSHTSLEHILQHRRYLISIHTLHLGPICFCERVVKTFPVGTFVIPYFLL